MHILSHPVPQEAWDIVEIDLLKLPLTSESLQYRLLAIDHFSRISVIVPLKKN